MEALSFQRVVSLSEAIREKLENLEEFRNSRVMSSYVAKSNEVQTERIIRDALNDGKKVLVPLVIPDDKRLVFSELRDFSELALGHFQISEPKREYFRPVSLEEADMILVPLVAWDETGNRLGHGRGYFDIALSPLRGKMTIGLAFEAQRVDRIPAEMHDIPLRMIITESRILRFMRPSDYN